MKQYDVFISCPHRDKAAGESACAAFEATGLLCWISSRDVPLGANWSESIINAIRNCRAMVVIFSENTNRSQQILKEIELARNYDVRILPVRIQDVPPEGPLAYHLSGIRWLDAFPPPLDAHLDRVVAATRAMLEQSRAIKDEGQRAAEDNLSALPNQTATSLTHNYTLPLASPDFPRTSPEYWLNRVGVERKLAPGDQPLVLISFASEDQEWVDHLRAFLDPKIELLHDAHNAPYRLWNFSDVLRGTAPGDEFPEIVAEKMWRCQTALILMSSDYFRSSYCRSIELPFLMWRRDRHQLLCLPIRIGTIPVDRVRIPAYETSPRAVMLDDLIDDRQAADDFSSSEYRELNLRQLQERKLKSEIEKRFEGISRHVIKFLKNKLGAQDPDAPQPIGPNGTARPVDRPNRPSQTEHRAIDIQPAKDIISANAPAAISETAQNEQTIKIGKREPLRPAPEVKQEIGRGESGVTKDTEPEEQERRGREQRQAQPQKANSDFKFHAVIVVVLFVAVILFILFGFLLMAERVTRRSDINIIPLKSAEIGVVQRGQATWFRRWGSTYLR
jgi:hypothetical protein